MEEMLYTVPEVAAILKTNVDYVYAVGDVCVGLKQWIVACGEGAVAATSAFTDIQ